MAKTIAVNKKAFHEYEITEKLEAGIVLTGAEIKAIRAHKINLTGSYARILAHPKPELFWLGGNIAVEHADPTRTRKLLIKREEINRLIGKAQEKGLTLIPLSLYLKKGRAKLEVGIGRGRKLHDKREKLKKRDLERELRRQE